MAGLLAACRETYLTPRRRSYRCGPAGIHQALQEFTPAERRLMLACIANYPKKEA